MDTDHLVVMAAGRGTRMDPLTRNRPKVLLEVAGRPLMEHLLRSAAEAGFRRATIIVNAGADLVRSTFGNGSGIGLDIAYVTQATTRGTGDAVASLAGHVADGFVLASGDSHLAPEDLRRLRSAQGPAVAGRHVDDARPYGLLRVEGGHVVGIQEKPTDAVASIVNAGAYRFSADIVDLCGGLAPSRRGEVELTDAVTDMARRGEAARLVETPSWQEAGRPWELLDLQATLLGGLETQIDGDVHGSVDIQGPVVVEAGARILSGTRIEGPAWIGAGAKVGPGAYLRPATSVGRDAHVGGSVEVKNSIVGARSHVPHLSYVGDSVIGQDCNLGAGTQVANLKVTERNVRVWWQGKEWLDTGRRKLGVIMGDDVKTGVNCSINPGTVLCDRVRIAAGQVVSGWIEADEGAPVGAHGLGP